MKILKYITIVMFFSAILFSCEKDYESHITKVTYFPSIEVLGGQFMTVKLGQAFTDPGVLVKIGDDEVDADEVSGTVDVNTIGVYTITYSKVNEDGFSASAQRFVGVIDPGVLANDFSGQYQRTAYGANTTPSGIATWTKVADGLYTCNNVGGVPDDNAFVYNVYVFNLVDNKVMVPTQPDLLGGGTIFCTSTKAGAEPDLIDFIPGAVGEVSYIWSVKGSSYGTNTRTFTRVN